MSTATLDAPVEKMTPAEIRAAIALNVEEERLRALTQFDAMARDMAAGIVPETTTLNTTLAVANKTLEDLQARAEVYTQRPAQLATYAAGVGASDEIHRGHEQIAKIKAEIQAYADSRNAEIAAIREHSSAAAMRQTQANMAEAWLHSNFHDSAALLRENRLIARARILDKAVRKIDEQLSSETPSPGVHTIGTALARVKGFLRMNDRYARPHVKTPEWEASQVRLEAAAAAKRDEQGKLKAELEAVRDELAEIARLKVTT